MTDWNKQKVVDLRNELKKRGLPLTGLKADLVDRLNAADKDPESESEATVQGDAGKDTAPSTSSETIENASYFSPPDNAEPFDEPVRSDADIRPPWTSAPEAMPEVTATNEHASSLPTSPTIETPRERPLSESRSSLPSVEPAEAIEDRQKRKRRSVTPPPSAADISRKRARQGEEPIHFQDDVATTRMDEAWVEKHNGANAEVKEVASAGGVQADPTLVDVSRAGIEVEPVQHLKDEVQDSPSKTRDSRYKDLVQPQNGSSQRDEDTMEVDADQDRNITPAIHPATSALYIRDLMRPLNMNSLKEHLAKLASARGQAVDPNVITTFYLDPIRTHCFVAFTSVSAASRVRSAIHDRIWPDESNRKLLWADFIPAEKVEAWSEEEKNSGDGGRSSMKKWEVYYDTDDEGRVIATLQEISGQPMSKQMRKPSYQAPPAPRDSYASQPVGVHPDRLTLVPGVSPAAPPVHPERLAFVRRGSATGSSTGPAVHPDRLGFVRTETPPAPANSHRGMDGVPSGPRSTQNREQRAAQNIGKLDDLFKYTEAKPKLYWQPVSTSLANSRIDKMVSSYTKDTSRHVGGEINRYTFEDGDVFVDRGPEIFSGIRPPRREGRGPPPFRGSGDRGHGGFGGGGGGESRGPPRGGYESEGRLGGGYGGRGRYEGRLTGGHESRGRYEGRGGYEGRRGNEGRGPYDSYRGGMRDSRDSRDSRGRRY